MRASEYGERIESESESESGSEGEEKKGESRVSLRFHTHSHPVLVAGTGNCNYLSITHMSYVVETFIKRSITFSSRPSSIA